ncbi:MAG: zinc-dependent metalloprotease, partial [Myxococcota bacterium]
SNIARKLWKMLEKPHKAIGSYQKMRKVFMVALSAHFRAGIQAVKFIGGLHHHRAHLEDKAKQLPFVPTSAKQQRKALQYLTREFLSPKAFDWPPSLLNKLSPNRLYGFRYISLVRNISLPIHRTVTILQLTPLYRILYPIRLARVEDIQLRQDSNQSYLSVQEIFHTVTGAVWQEIIPSKPASRPTATQTLSTTSQAPRTQTYRISSLRHTLQRTYIELLAAYTNANTTPVANAQMAARTQIIRIQDAIQHARPQTKELQTRQHLDFCQARIRQILNTTQIRVR